MVIVNYFLYVWLIYTLHRFGGLHSLLAAFFILFLSLYLALYPLIFLILIRKYKRYPFFFPVFWLILEIIRGWFLSGFTFNLIGYSLYKARFLIMPARFYTVYGVGFFIVLLSTLIVNIKRKNMKFILIFALVVYFIPLLAFLSPYEKPNINIAMLETSFEPEDKRINNYDVFWKYHYQNTKKFLTSDHKIDLMIWSETSFPLTLKRNSYEFMRLRDLVTKNDINLVFGAMNYSNGKYYNSSIFLNKNGIIEDIYSKNHLVLFGEYFPLRNFPILKNIYGQFLDFTPGEEIKVFSIGKTKIYTPICYEIAFGSLIRKAVKHGAKIIINTSNDGWYGYSSGPIQEVPFAVFRAIEGNVWVGRAINRGYGVIVRPDGKIIYTNDPKTWGVITLDQEGKVDFYKLYMK